jgi:hypothetical protein
MRSMILVLAAACASGGAHYGSVALKSGANAAARPVSYSVGEGTIRSSNLEARVDQGCVRGSVGAMPLQLCSDPADPTRWSGASGDFTARTTEDGQAVMVSGYLALDAGRRVQMDQSIALGKGSQWDELRKHPELLAIAATAADLQAAHVRP